MSKLKLAVIMGGISSEHNVSMMSGSEIINNLNKEKYSIYTVVINKNGKGINKILKIRPDIVFIALHGKGGEDGKIQGFLDTLNIKYTGSGVAASAIGMDKIVFRHLLMENKIEIPSWVAMEKGATDISIPFKPPYFIKPYDCGSSVGAGISFSKKDIAGLLKNAFKYSEKVLIDKYIKGLEVSCGVLGNKHPWALPVIEIKPLKDKFFDYKSKYENNGSEEIVPANISHTIAKEIQDLSVKIYKIVGCRGYARVDYILENKNKPIVLEINTLPGMTVNSLLPKEAKAAGISYSKLLDKIIDYANKR